MSALSLAALLELLDAQKDEVESWLAAEFAKREPPFYCSVDVRVSEHKIAPIDTNLFPGGFNNLGEKAREQAGAAARAVVQRQWPEAKRALVIAERHTRNPYYAEHLTTLRAILEAAGLEVRLALAAGEPATLRGHREEFELAPVARSGDRLTAADGFEPDLVILNHDQSGGTPAILEDVAQPVLPPPRAGWAHRRKSAHFFQYERVAARFARAFGFDPWLITSYFNVCHRVDISRNIGLGCLEQVIDDTLGDIAAKYRELGTDSKPFAVLKADAGTYGMGVVMVDEAEQVRRLNRRQRSNLSSAKDGVAINDILVQEGVPTADRIEGLVAEPVCYMIGAEVVGGFWRLNQSKGPRENLNSRGMLFWSMPQQSPSYRRTAHAIDVVARLALLATTRELADEFARSGG